MISHRQAAFRRAEPVMGTVASLDIRDRAPDDLVEAAAAEVIGELRRVEAVFSRFSPTSVISQLNRGELDLQDCPAEVHEVLAACRWLERDSGGAFSYRDRPARGDVDPTGYVKGWAAQRAAERLTTAGLRHWCLNVGGDLVTRGKPATDRHWQIAIADPADNRLPLVVVAVSDLAVATSGTGERGAHVWDARQGRPADALVSFTVVGPELRWADAFATVGLVLGSEEGLAWVAGHDGYDALSVAPDRTMSATPGFAARLVGG